MTVQLRIRTGCGALLSLTRHVRTSSKSRLRRPDEHRRLAAQASHRPPRSPTHPTYAHPTMTKLAALARPKPKLGRARSAAWEPAGQLQDDRVSREFMNTNRRGALGLYVLRAHARFCGPKNSAEVVARARAVSPLRASGSEIACGDCQALARTEFFPAGIAHFDTTRSPKIEKRRRVHAASCCSGDLPSNVGAG